MPAPPSDHRKNDRVIVLLSILIGGGLAGYVITQALGFKEKFDSPSAQGVGDSETRISRIADIAIETSRLQGRASGSSQPEWTTHRAAGRDRGFLVSTNLVFVRGAAGTEGVIVDLDKEEPMLRPPFPNAWLVKHNLPLEYTNVGELDTDEDFFSNREEYEFGLRMGVGFDPTDKSSHPPLHYRLTFSRTSEAPYELTYSSGQGEQFFFRRGDGERNDRWSAMATLGAPFPERPKNIADQNRFTVTEANTVEEQAEGADFNIVKGIVTVEDSTRPQGHPLRTFQMREGDSINLPIIEAVFDFPATPGRPITVREFERFTLPGTEGPQYILKSVNESAAVIVFEENGQLAELSIPIGKRAEP